MLECALRNSLARLVEPAEIQNKGKLPIGTLRHHDILRCRNATRERVTERVLGRLTNLYKGALPWQATENVKGCRPVRALPFQQSEVPYNSYWKVVGFLGSSIDWHTHNDRYDCGWVTLTGGKAFHSITYGSPIFKVVQKKWYPASSRALTKSPISPESAVGEGAERSHVDRSGVAP